MNMPEEEKGQSDLDAIADGSTGHLLRPASFSRMDQAVVHERVPWVLCSLCNEIDIQFGEVKDDRNNFSSARSPIFDRGSQPHSGAALSQFASGDSR